MLSKHAENDIFQKLWFHNTNDNKYIFLYICHLSVLITYRVSFECDLNKVAQFVDSKKNAGSAVFFIVY